MASADSPHSVGSHPGRLSLAVRLAAFLVLAVGCGPDDPPLVDPAQEELLDSLGYVDYGDQPDEAGDGAVVFHRKHSVPGLNLLTYPGLRRADLIDAEGRVVRAWTGNRRGDRWERVIALPDGDVLAITRPAGLLRLGPDGTTRWESDVPVHHFAVPLPDGRIMALTVRKRAVEGFSQPEVADNGIAILAPTGEVLEEVSILDAARRRPEVFHVRKPKLETLAETDPLDILHANRFDWIATASGDGPVQPGRILITIRNQEAVVILDWESRELVWAWGRGRLGMPHDGSVVDGGNILVFNNLAGDGWSRIVEIDPVSEKTVWSYQAPKRRDFYSASRGTVQRLEGGNTLIGESNRGRAFEVTPNGKIVWEYRTPYRNKQGRRAAFRVDRYPLSE